MLNAQSSKNRLADHLRVAITACDKMFPSPIQLILSSTDPLSAYRTYLAATYHIITASTDLMQCAIERLNKEHADDLRLDRIAHYLTSHTIEEQDHAQWALEDLKTICTENEFSVFVQNNMSANVCAIPGIGYYMIRNSSAISVFGYIYAFEYNPPSEEAIDSIIAQTKMPVSAVRTLKAHSSLDPNHMQELEDLLNDTEFSVFEINSMRRTGEMCSLSFGSAIVDILTE